MAWRLTYLVTTLPRVTAEVNHARTDWGWTGWSDGDAAFHPADPNKIGYGVPSPVTKDNLGRPYLCELVSTHYNAEKDELIFVWEPKMPVDNLPAELQNVPDADPTAVQVKYAGEPQPGKADVHTEPTPAGS